MLWRLRLHRSNWSRRSILVQGCWISHHIRVHIRVSHHVGITRYIRVHIGISHHIWISHHVGIFHSHFIIDPFFVARSCICCLVVFRRLFTYVEAGGKGGATSSFWNRLPRHTLEIRPQISLPWFSLSINSFMWL